MLAALWLAVSPAHAESVADFYRGRTINVLIGVNVGGGYDFEARLLARFMRAHIPGNPLLVPQNVIGAGGIKMANYLYSIAAQDGTAVGMFPSTLVAAQAVGTDGVQYDANKFAWLGSVTTSPVTLAVWRDSPVQSLGDARKQEVVVAASNKGAITYTFPHMLNELLGTKFKIVSGYQGNSTMTVACSAVPEIGLISTRAAAAASMKAGSRMVASKASRSACTRSGGTLGEAASGLPSASPETISAMTCRSLTLRASSCTEGMSGRSFALGSVCTSTLILPSRTHAGLNDFQLSQELVTPCTSPRSMATVMVLLPW